MKKAILSILTNQCKKNKLAIITLLTVFIILIVFSPFVVKLIDSTAFYYGNKSYNILLSKSSPTGYENNAYLLNDDFLLQKNKTINAQCIMLKENIDYSSTFKIKSLSANEMIISKSIALNNNIHIGDYVDIDINYNHTIAKYKVVDICDYWFDITQDINIFSSPIFFVGYDEEYVNNSILTYLSFYDKGVDVSTIITVDSIIANYKCDTRAMINGFILILLILVVMTITLIGYYFFSKSLEKVCILKIVCNSGISYKKYMQFVLLINIFSAAIYCLSLILLIIISCIWSMKYFYVIILCILLLTVCSIIETCVIHKKINFLGVKND